MNFNPDLQKGDIINNQELHEIFKCGNMGGMRKSNKKNSLVIISDHTKSLYDDKWIDNVLHYTGMGKLGDQKLDFRQNKTLAQSDTNSINLFLFEVFNPGKYIYMGKVKLCGEPYQQKQPDDNGDLRNVWIFPLCLEDTSIPSAVDVSILKKLFQTSINKVKKLSKDTIAAKAKEFGTKKVGSRTTVTTTYTRNPFVSEHAKIRANGNCQLCEKPAPFLNKNNEPYLETHHIVWLSKGGSDTIENTVALCPNCHRKMHKLDLEIDRNKLMHIAKNNYC